MAGGVDALLLLDGGALVLHLEAGHVPALLLLLVLTFGVRYDPTLLVLDSLTVIPGHVLIPAANILVKTVKTKYNRSGSTYIVLTRTGSPCLAFVLRDELTLFSHNVPTQSLIRLAALRLQLGLVDGLALLLSDRVAALHVQLDTVGVLVGGAHLVGLVGADVVALGLEETLVVLVSWRSHQGALLSVGRGLVVFHVMLVMVVVLVVGMVVMMVCVMFMMSVVVVVVVMISSSLEVRLGYRQGSPSESENKAESLKYKF